MILPNSFTLSSFDYHDVDGIHRHQGTIIPMSCSATHLAIRFGEAVKLFERGRIVNLRSHVIFNPTYEQVVMYMGHEDEGNW